MSDNREYPSRPWVGVGVVVWKGDEVLLVRRGRHPRKGEWSIPGGGQALGETVFEAAIREVREETGLIVRPIGIVTVVDAILRDADERPQFHYTLIEVNAEWTAGEARAADDVDDVRWVHPVEAVDFVKWDETLRVIEMARQARV
ncbi:MAG TPA: NUDIX hydrolase [Alphaproteobacteria bacterium]|jgi:ADP-ribose pyrophosphatase YjhB (NUDIX family)|nr:NUDIX hydrolase [Alphaproteobacteria bacterium]